MMGRKGLVMAGKFRSLVEAWTKNSANSKEAELQFVPLDAFDSNNPSESFRH